MTTPRHGKTEASAVVSALIRSWGGDVRHIGVDPDRPCPHEDFVAVVEVNRLTNEEGGPVEAFSADVRIRCAGCDEPMRFIGAPAGMMPNRPACSVDETEIHLPIRPASSDPDFGLGIPGFAVTVRDYRNNLGMDPDA